MTVYKVFRKNLDDIEQEIQEQIDAARFVVAVTGAGISVASGLPVVSEVVNGVSLSKFFSPDLFKESPLEYFHLYRSLLRSWRAARPNPAHEALAKAGVWVITQNVDGLHRDAGSEHLIELHGNLRELVCERCSTRYPSQLVWEQGVPECFTCGSVLYPGVVLEGKEIRHYSRAVDWVGRAELLFVVGTELNSSPVQELPHIATNNGVDVVWVNDAAESVIPSLLSFSQGVEE